jgi:acyl carrier protein
MAANSISDSDGEVLTHVLGILEEITADWDVGTISAESRLVELNLESINLVYFIAELQQSYGLEQHLFARIRSAGRPLAELRVADIAEYVQEICRAREARCEEPRHG